MLRATVIRDVAGAERLAPLWRELMDRASVAEPVSTPTWLFAWWHVFGGLDGRKLRLVAVEDDAGLVAVVPLCARRVLYRRVIPVRRLELLATGEPEEDEICSDYVGAVVASGREADVARELATLLDRGTLGGWDELFMPAMSGDDPFPRELLGALAPLAAATSLEPSGRCPFITLPATWDDYLKSLDGSCRYVVVRALREVDKLGAPDGYRLRRASTREELDEGKRILLSLHGERWDEAGKTGVFASPRFRRFHDQVMPRLLDGIDGSLDLLWLTVRGEPVSALYNIVYRNKVYFYQSGRKVDVPKAFRPGIAIQALAIRRSIEQGHREYDFLNGMSQYKRQLSLESRPLVTLRAVAPSLRARALDRAIAMAERAWRTAHPRGG